MNRTKRLAGKIGFVFCTALLGALTGCVGYVDRPGYGGAYVQPRPVQVETAFAVQDDYMYYPGYQVYYSSNRRQFVYMEGRFWVARPAPPHVSVDVLFASPSVRLDFHDSPANHHATVVRQDPKHWAPPGQSPNRGKGQKDKGKGNDRGGRR